MYPYECLCSRQIKQKILDEIVDYGDDLQEKIIGSDSENEDINVDQMPNNEDQEMECSDEEKHDTEIDRYEESNRIKFLEMFNSKSDYPSAYSIIKSGRLDWGKTKIERIFKIYKTFGVFPDDKRNTNSPFKKLKAEHLEFIIQKLNEDNSIKSPEIVNLLNNRFDMNISERTIQRSLNEKGYEYVGWKIKPKNDLHDQKIRFNWCNRHINDNWYNIFFTDETTIYLNNPGSFKWIKTGEQANYIEGRKINLWGAISYRGKWTLYVFEENLDTNMYLKILTDSLAELNEIADKKILLQMDNARVHWAKDSLIFYKENDIWLIDWPANSPDLNPIENLWAYVKHKLGDKKYTKNQLIAKIHSIWNDISNEQIQSTWTSIYERIQQWLDSEGKLTNF